MQFAAKMLVIAARPPLGDYYEIVINRHPNKYWTV